MKLWNKIKQMWTCMREREKEVNVISFMLGSEYAPDWLKPKCLKNIDDRLAYKRKLVASYTYQEGDDLLSKKQDFIDQYTVNEKEQIQYFTQTPMDCVDRARCRAWRDHEQLERFQGQKAWRQVVRRNTYEHMRSKFINQKTR